MSSNSRSKSQNEFRRPGLVVCGFPATGKTSLARYLAGVFGEQEVLDLDCLLEQKLQKSIAEVIGVEGEEFFREQEEHVLKEALLERKPSVLVLGGGALLRENNRALLGDLQERGEIRLVSLRASEETIVARVFKDESLARELGKSCLRPLLAGSLDGRPSLDSCRKEVVELLKKREGLYELASLELWTEWEEVERLGAKLLELVSQSKGEQFCSMPASAEGVPLGEVRIGSGIFSGLGKSIEQLFPRAEKVAVFVDASVNRAWSEKIKHALASEKFKFYVCELPSGEKTKAFGFLEQSLERLLELGLTRSDVVLGIGGGVVGDLCGLVASLYMRGLGLVHVPTTIVAQVDSAIGGKTAVNLDGGKNLVGTFYPASLVLSDLDFLQTLPEREFKAGLAEVIKYGLIYSAQFFDWFEASQEDICRRNTPALKKIVLESSRIKLDFVCKDLRDLSGKRAMLNYGHTLGHVIEKLGNYGELLHGEAVSIGMVFAFFLGTELGKTSDKELARLKALLERCSLPSEVPASFMLGASEYLADRSSVLDGKRVWHEFEESSLSPVALSFYKRFRAGFFADKKRISSKVSFILLESLGKACVEDVAVDFLIDRLALFCVGAEC